MRFLRYDAASGKWGPVHLLVEPDLALRLREAEATMCELQTKLRLGRVMLAVKMGRSGTEGQGQEPSEPGCKAT